MERRTALVTATSIVGVVLAGATAVGANIRILDQSDESGIGQLSAAAPADLDTYSTDDDDSTTQTFRVAEAGSVRVESDGDGLRLGSIDTAEGWSWSADQPDSDHLEVTFSSSTTTYLFRAAVDADGVVTAVVDEPVETGYHDEYEGHDEYEDHDEHEDDEHEDDEHEDHDEHDEHEYEGRDDDD
jgi:hypothetical protein